jgi:NTE family protein
MDVSNKQPSLEETMNAVTDVQLHRYNAATLNLMDKTVARWSRELSTPGRSVDPYFIQLSFRDFDRHDERQFFNL